MKKIEWELLIIQIMFNWWKRPELFSKEFRMALWKIEEEGIISPVISISCEYKATTTFADQVSIEISVKSVKLSKLSFLYRMVNQDCILVCTTVSEHSFLSKEGSFVNLKKWFPCILCFVKRTINFRIKKKIKMIFFFILQEVFDKYLNFHHQRR